MNKHLNYSIVILTLLKAPRALKAKSGRFCESGDAYLTCGANGIEVESVTTQEALYMNTSCACKECAGWLELEGVLSLQLSR